MNEDGDSVVVPTVAVHDHFQAAVMCGRQNRGVCGRRTKAAALSSSEGKGTVSWSEVADSDRDWLLASRFSLRIDAEYATAPANHDVSKPADNRKQKRIPEVGNETLSKNAFHPLLTAAPARAHVAKAGRPSSPVDAVASRKPDEHEVSADGPFTARNGRRDVNAGRTG